MKKSEALSIFWAIIITLAMIGISWLVFKITKNKFQGKGNSEIVKTDTVYIPEIFTIPEPLEIIMNPSTIEIYKPDTSNQYEFSLREKDLKLSASNQSDSIFIDKNYLNTLPMNPKLLHLDLTKKQLSLGLIDINGITRRDLYSLDLENYKYQWQGNTITKQKVKYFKFSPTISYQYRPINNLHDIDILLNFNTTKFNYKFGLNGFYYSQFQNKPSWDVVIGLTFNLN